MGIDDVRMMLAHAEAKIARLGRLLDASGPDGARRAVPAGLRSLRRTPLVPPPSIQWSPDPP